MYEILFTKQAVKDAALIRQSALKRKAAELLAVLADNPLQAPPAYEPLKGDRQGSYSRRINRQHRLVYEVLPNDKNTTDANGEAYDGIVKIIRMWTHYE